MTKPPLGTFLQLRRLELNLSPTELARISGVGRATIYRYETGAYSPQTHTLARLQPWLKLTAEEMSHYVPQTRPGGIPIRDRVKPLPSDKPANNQDSESAIIFFLPRLSDMTVTQDDLVALLLAETASRPLHFETAIKLLYRRLVHRTVDSS